ncbi:MAG: hypothetical protein ABJA66_12010 [Actinomycetota bacterium]
MLKFLVFALLFPTLNMFAQKPEKITSEDIPGDVFRFENFSPKDIFIKEKNPLGKGILIFHLHFC